MKTIRFKSTADNWRREYLGLKCNTVRIYEPDDVRFELLDKYIDGLLNLLSIEIQNRVTNEVFSRVITDVIKYDHLVIISWKGG